jgi:predicted site-specific integrase-resolvase
MTLEVFMKVLLYARSASQTQDDEPSAVAVQQRDMWTVAIKEGWTVLSEFCDPCTSGRSIGRMGLTALLGRLAQGGVDAVVVCSIDRLARSANFVHRLEQAFARHGVMLISLDNENAAHRASELQSGVFPGRIEEQARHTLTIQDRLRTCRQLALSKGYVPIAEMVDTESNSIEDASPGRS